MSRLFFHSFLSLRFRSRSSPCALTSSRRETVTRTFHLHYRQCEFISTRSPPNIPSFKDINGRGIKNTLGLPGINEGDSKSLSQNDSSKRFLQGEVLDFARDLRKIRPGDIIQVPYEVTITESVHDFWHSAFHSQDRITTSTPFSRKIGLQDRILPFSLVLFLTSSMTHADAAKVQVGYDNVIYHWPCFAGDTFTKIFQVLSVRNTSDGNHTVISFACQLVNQRGRICMTADKRMMFPFTVEHADSPITSASTIRSKLSEQDIYLFRNHILSQAKELLNIGSHSLKGLRTGHLILHRMNRSVSLTQSQQLASLARLTHERHFDVRKYDTTSEILVPGGVVLGLTLSAASRDLHEILYEEIYHANFVNSLHPGNVVGAVSYVQLRDETPHDLECLEVITIGIKNMDVHRDLEGVQIPLELFIGGDLLPKTIERICKERCPILSKKIVVHIKRKIIRQAPRKQVFLL